MMNILVKYMSFVVQIVGAIKSLESLGDVVSTSLKTVKKWQLTEVRRTDTYIIYITDTYLRFIVFRILLW
jgi:hypothetical protein